MLALSLVRHTRKSLSVAPVSPLTSFMPYTIVCFATSVVATFSVASSPARLTSITSCRLSSLEFLSLVVCGKVISSPAVPPLAATDAHDCVEVEGVFGCARKDRMAFWSSDVCSSDLDNARAVTYLLYAEVLKCSSCKPFNILYALYNSLLCYFSSSYLLCCLFICSANVYY